MAATLDIDTSLPRARPDAGVIVALSGGLDSSALLHALASDPMMRARGLRAVHVNHGLHADAGHWETHCARLCTSLGVPLRAIEVQVTPDGDGLEAAARRARHAALQDAASAGDVIALAHHLDDQAETFLLRALRASGPDGLRAMQPWRGVGGSWLWRPLLQVSRTTIEAYARAHGLVWIDDPSNSDTDFDRNFLRTHVLPRLRERWPHAAKALADSAALCADVVSLLDVDDAAALAALRRGPNTLDADALAALPAPRRARVLRAWTADLDLPALPSRGVACVEEQLLTARAGTQAEFAWSGVRIRRWGDLLWAGATVPALPAAWEERWDARAPLTLPDGGSLHLEGPDALAAPMTVRARLGGERIRLPNRTHRHALKHVLQGLRVPPWERGHLPLLFADDGELEAAGDVVASARFAAWLAESGARLRWNRPPGASRH